MKDSFILACDFGTSGMKMSLVDSTMDIIDVAVSDYRYCTPVPGWAQMDPNLFIDALKQAVRAMAAKRSLELQRVDGLIFCTQWKGLIPVDRHGQALHDALLWLDKRAQGQADALNTILATNMFTSADCIPKIVWLREHHPELYEATFKFLEINSFLTCFATGVMAIDETGHYGKSRVEQLQQAMDRGLLAAGIPAEKVPAIVQSDEVVGYLTEDAAQRLGLKSAIPVYGGICDIPAVALGTGIVLPGQSHFYFGSSGWLATVLPGTLIPHNYRCVPFIDGTIIRLDGLEAVGLARSWALGLLFTPDQTAHEGFEQWLEKSIASLDSSNSSLLAIPLIHKENPPLPADVCGTFWGMRANDGKIDVYLAVLEGICFLMRLKLENLESESGPADERIAVSGGGASSATWMQMLADITGRTIMVVSSSRYAGAIGAARCVLKNSGKKAQVDRTYVPDVHRKARFDTKYHEFIQLFALMVEHKEIRHR